MIKEEAIFNSLINLRVMKTGESTRVISNYVNLKDNLNNFADGKIIYAFIGPAGSGKSTTIAHLLEQGVLGNCDGKYAPFVNRYFYNLLHNGSFDVEQEKKFKEYLIRNGKSFITESAGFDDAYFNYLHGLKEKYGAKICLIYITKRFPFENLLSIQKRVREGGHDLSGSKEKLEQLKEMYINDGKNLKKLLPISDCAFVIRNTTQINEKKPINPVILKRKTLNGSVISSDIMKYQLEYEQIINPKVKDLKFRVFYTVKNPKLLKLMPNKYKMVNGRYVDKKTGEIMTVYKITLKK